MKKVLGLDLGTTSIGWALVNEKENDNVENVIQGNMIDNEGGEEKGSDYKEESEN